MLRTASGGVNQNSNGIPNRPAGKKKFEGMTAPEMFEYMITRGCQDHTLTICHEATSPYPVATGACGDIWKGRLYDGTVIAIKVWRFRPEAANSYESLVGAMRELYNWSKIDHENIHKLLGVMMFQGRLGMISTWMENGDLGGYMRRHEMVDRYPLCVQVANAVRYLHENNMVHGDLKACNFLVSSEGVVKLSDFDNSIRSNCSLAFPEANDRGGGTLRWMAPELLLSPDPPRRNQQTDIYALGMTVLEIITGAVPYASQCRRDETLFITLSRRMLPTRTEHFQTSRGALVWPLLVRCWDHEPNARPDANEVLDLMGKAESTLGAPGSISASSFPANNKTHSPLDDSSRSPIRINLTVASLSVGSSPAGDPSISQSANSDGLGASVIPDGDGAANIVHNPKRRESFNVKVPSNSRSPPVPKPNPSKKRRLPSMSGGKSAKIWSDILSSWFTTGKTLFAKMVPRKVFRKFAPIRPSKVSQKPEPPATPPRPLYPSPLRIPHSNPHRSRRGSQAATASHGERTRTPSSREAAARSRAASQATGRSRVPSQATDRSRVPSQAAGRSRVPSHATVRGRVPRRTSLEKPDGSARSRRPSQASAARSARSRTTDEYAFTRGWPVSRDPLTNTSRSQGPDNGVTRRHSTPLEPESRCGNRLSLQPLTGSNSASPPATPTLHAEQPGLTCPETWHGLSLAQVAVELAPVERIRELLECLRLVFQGVERSKANKKQWKLLQDRCAMVVRITGAQFTSRDPQERAVDMITDTLNKISERIRHYSEMHEVAVFLQFQAISDQIRIYFGELDSSLSHFSCTTDIAHSRWFEEFRAVQQRELKELHRIHKLLLPLNINPEDFSQAQLVEIDKILRQELADKFKVLQTQGSMGSADFTDAQEVVCTILTVTKLQLPSELLLGRVCIPDTKAAVKTGTTCDIYAARFLGGEIAAKKVFRVGVNDAGSVKQHAERILEMASSWRDFSPDYVLPFYGVGIETFEGDQYSQLYTVSPLMNNFDAMTHLAKYRDGEGMRHHILRIVRDAAKCLQYLHNRNPPFVHSNMRGENILITDSEGAILAGFGLSKAFESEVHDRVPSAVLRARIEYQRWMAPELFLEDYPQVQTPSDVWGWAMTALEIVTGSIPYHTHPQDFTVISRILEGPPRRRDYKKFDDYAYRPDEMWKLLEQCWAYEPSERPTMDAVMARLNEIAEMPEHGKE